MRQLWIGLEGWAVKQEALQTNGTGQLKGTGRLDDECFMHAGTGTKSQKGSWDQWGWGNKQWGNQKKKRSDQMKISRY